MKAVQISKAGGNLEIVERPVPQPGRGQVRIKVEACGICHSDALVKEGLWPGIQYPRVPGHEIAGRIDAIGPDVTLWKPGQRVGVGWHGGHCFQCDPCRRGDFVLCQNEKITAISFDGGYAEYWWRRQKRSRPCPTICRLPRLPRYFAPESPYSTRCAILAHAAETW
jgi:alcohol dehydrogenase/propanol-preferring alcohol dehydrogenase